MPRRSRLGVIRRVAGDIRPLFPHRLATLVRQPDRNDLHVTDACAGAEIGSGWLACGFLPKNPDDSRGFSGILGGMNDVVITVPGAVLAGAKLPRRGLEAELRRRLAMALFSDGVISGAAACHMAGVEKAEFQFLMGERGIAQPLDESDLAQDAAGIAAWKARR